jgi:hypothetical protein
MRSDLVGFMGSIDRWLAVSVKLLRGSGIRGGRGFPAEMNQDGALLRRRGCRCIFRRRRGVQRFSIKINRLCVRCDEKDSLVCVRACGRGCY